MSASGRGLLFARRDLEEPGHLLAAQHERFAVGGENDVGGNDAIRIGVEIAADLAGKFADGANEVAGVCIEESNHVIAPLHRQ